MRLDPRHPAAAAERVFRLMDEAPEAPDKKNALSLSDVEGNIGFEKVSFHYNEGEEVLHDINIDIPKGSIVAIVGPTGAGKTTILNVLGEWTALLSEKSWWTDKLSASTAQGN